MSEIPSELKLFDEIIVNSDIGAKCHIERYSDRVWKVTANIEDDHPDYGAWATLEIAFLHPNYRLRTVRSETHPEFFVTLRTEKGIYFTQNQRYNTVVIDKWRRFNAAVVQKAIAAGYDYDPPDKQLIRYVDELLLILGYPTNVFNTTPA